MAAKRKKRGGNEIIRRRGGVTTRANVFEISADVIISVPRAILTSRFICVGGDVFQYYYNEPSFTPLTVAIMIRDSINQSVSLSLKLW